MMFLSLAQARSSQTRFGMTWAGLPRPGLACFGLGWPDPSKSLVFKVPGLV